ncbi:phage head-tail connector protein [Romboutsia sp. 1001285H_161024_C4]|uniref:phage head-tail connector protein n=1 Tax=Romboutsia sp. 1001285H_161024_C4 TaxID=2787109 RepID=UPI00189B9D6D|nr:phage head-tail connector protein [Romboutsia sp. 1001285H_161024_C4]
MFENIKLVLNLTDDSHDELIMYYINKFTNIVLEYCNRDDLNNSLESFIEDKVIEVINHQKSSTNLNGIKSISRGDTKIEYGTNSNNYINTSNLSNDDKKIISRFARVKLC